MENLKKCNLSVYSVLGHDRSLAIRMCTFNDDNGQENCARIYANDANGLTELRRDRGTFDEILVLQNISMHRFS